MKHFEILGGKAMVVELPEGATNLTMDGYLLGYDLPSPDDWGYNYDTIRLPEGTWQIVGMLPEVTADDVSDLTGHYYNKYNERHVEFACSATRVTPIDDLESAILAEGYIFENNLTNPDDVCYFSRDRMIEDVKEWHEAQSRVLSRERCLLLRRVDL